MKLDGFTMDFARALMRVDALAPRATSARSGMHYQAGIGPHSEAETIRLTMTTLAIESPADYGRFLVGKPYPKAPRQKVDLLLSSEAGDWALEFKLFRLLGDNGRLNDNMAMHIFSPYPQHRSALTDCEKLAQSGFEARKGIVIVGYESNEWPLELALQTFEILARHRFALGSRVEAGFDGLIHPVHRSGRIVAWELLDS